MNSDISPRELERVAFCIAGQASGYLRDLFGQEELSIVVGRGASGDATRKIDALAEDFTIELLRSTGLDLFIISEEKGVIKASEKPSLIVLVDPLDGSLNYTLGIPNVAVSIVFYDAGNPYLSRALAGAVSVVFTKEIYSFDDRMVYLNKAPIENYRSRRSGIAVVYTNNTFTFRAVHRFMAENYGSDMRLRILGSAAMESLFAALGKIEFFLHNTGRLRNLDVAGGYAVAQRLGAKIIDANGKPVDSRTDSIDFIKSIIIGGEKILKLPDYLKE